MLGFSLKHALRVPDIGKLAGSESKAWLLLARFLVGALCVQLTRYLGHKSLCGLISLLSAGLRSSQLAAKEYIKSHFYLDLAFYFFCYTLVSFSAAFTSFFLFHHLALC